MDNAQRVNSGIEKASNLIRHNTILDLVASRWAKPAPVPFRCLAAQIQTAVWLT
jgi:hypothetical protein